MNLFSLLILLYDLEMFYRFYIYALGIMNDQPFLIFHS
jgi:hypothetical protein